MFLILTITFLNFSDFILNMAEQSQANKTLDELHLAAGDGLSKLLDAYLGAHFFENKEELIEWFYDPNNEVLGKSPYDFCREGRQYELECQLMGLIISSGD